MEAGLEDDFHSIILVKGEIKGVVKHDYIDTSHGQSH